MQKIFSKLVIGIIMLSIFLAPVSATIVKIKDWVVTNLNLDFIYKSNILLIISHQRHRNVCAGFVLSNNHI